MALVLALHTVSLRNAISQHRDMELRGQVHQVCGGREIGDVSPLKWRGYCNPAGSPITALSGLPGIQIPSSSYNHKRSYSIVPGIPFQRLDHNPNQQSHNFVFALPSPYSTVSICQTPGGLAGKCTECEGNATLL
jgi:hypothetical protein